MSFINHDEELANILSVIGANHLNKYGQYTNTDYKNYELAKKLLIDLQRQIDHENAPPVASPIGTEHYTPVKLSDVELRNIGDFITWAARNKITWNGKPFAWTPQDYQAGNVPPEAGEFSAYKINRERDDRRQPVKVTAYALKNELISFIEQLRDSEENKNNRVMQVMIGKLINQVNDNLPEGDPKVTPKPKETKTPDVTLNNIIVDGLPSVLDPENPYDGIEKWHSNFSDAPVKLNASIIDNKGMFKNWLLNLKIKAKDGVHIGTENVNMPESDNICIAVNIIYKRAFFLANQVGDAHDAEVPNYSKMADLYLKQIQEVGRTFTGKNGEPCPVITPISGGVKPGEGKDSIPGGTTTPGGTSGPGGLGAGGEDVISIMNSLLTNNILPYSMQDIDTHRIQVFLDNMKKIFTVDTNPQVQQRSSTITSYINDVEKDIKNLQNYFTLGVPPLTVGGGIDQIIPMVKPGVGNIVQVILGYMKIVKETEIVLNAFRSWYGPRLKDPRLGLTKLYDDVNKQLDSIKPANWSVLQQWFSQARQQSTIKK